MFHRFSLQSRMLLAICSTGLLTFAVTIALVSWQASDMAEANFNAVTNTAVNAAKTAAPRKR